MLDTYLQTERLRFHEGVGPNFQSKFITGNIKLLVYENYNITSPSPLLKMRLDFRLNRTLLIFFQNL